MWLAAGVTARDGNVLAFASQRTKTAGRAWNGQKLGSACRLAACMVHVGCPLQDSAKWSTPRPNDLSELLLASGERLFVVPGRAHEARVLAILICTACEDPVNARQLAALTSAQILCELTTVLQDNDRLREDITTLADAAVRTDVESYDVESATSGRIGDQTTMCMPGLERFRDWHLEQIVSPAAPPMALAGPGVVCAAILVPQRDQDCRASQEESRSVLLSTTMHGAAPRGALGRLFFASCQVGNIQLLDAAQSLAWRRLLSASEGTTHLEEDNFFIERGADWELIAMLKGTRADVEEGSTDSLMDKRTLNATQAYLEQRRNQLSAAGSSTKSDQVRAETRTTLAPPTTSAEGEATPSR